MLLRYSFGLQPEADRIDAAIGETLAAGDRTADLPGSSAVIGCREMGHRVAARM